jgi:low affinity Fe/Cu permease
VAIVDQDVDDDRYIRKLNELIHAIGAAGHQMMDIERLSDEELDVLQARYEKIRAACMEVSNRKDKNQEVRV